MSSLMPESSGSPTSGHIFSLRSLSSGWLSNFIEALFKSIE